MPPHATPLVTYLREGFKPCNCIQHIHGVSWVAISPCCFPFRSVMTAIIDLVHNVSIACQVIYIGNISLSRPIHLRRNIAMVEDDCRPSSHWHLTKRYGQQTVDPNPFRFMPCHMPVIV